MESLLETFFPNQFCILFGVGLLLLLIAEVGYRMGVSIPVREDEAAKSEIGGYQGAVLGLLALLLGFTFSMALTHYDLRRNLVVQEANSIGTTYLRASFLPGEARDISRRLLCDYVQLRTREDASLADQSLLSKQAAGIQAALWKQTESAAALAPTPITASYITSLNETIDLASTRLAAARYRVPGALWLLLLIVAIFGMWAAGFSAGVNGKRALFLTIGLPVLITLVLLLITDISSPRRGLIRNDESSMLELRDSMKQP
jgi:hypothetical protein